ncbi:MAG: alpha-glucan family phosphorylase [Chloroflexota bacterium]
MTEGYLLRPLPSELEPLAELAPDLRWSWNHSADKLWQMIDPELWAVTGNPWLVLQSTKAKRLEELAADPVFLRLMNESVAEYREAMGKKPWFEEAHPKSPLNIAYFSMEFGLGEALPIYSGGLGILAGDYLKTASDLGVPAVGVGLLYQQGYFRQALDVAGRQRELYPFNDPSLLPVVPTRDGDGEWLQIEVDLPGRHLVLRAWEAKVGRTTLYLLDSNHPVNSPADRGITTELYGGGPELRLQQEMALGIGGWRLLQAVGVGPDICHLNEGHAALVVLERARTFAAATRQQFDVALAATRAGNVFTTHTPVEAGFDRFAPELVKSYLEAYADQLGIGLDGLLSLGRLDPGNRQEPLNMAYLAIRGSRAINGVSRLHGEVSRRIFQPLFSRWPRREVPVTHVTNGVHVPSWDSAAADDLWTGCCGKERWLGTLDAIERNLKQVSDETMWAFRNARVEQLVGYTRGRLERQLASVGTHQQEIGRAQRVLNPNFFTMGFARRFTSYKRPNLLLYDPDRLARLLNDPQRPVQVIVAGKAHPRDEAGKAMIKAWSDFVHRPDVRSRSVFLADYDMSLAQEFAQGVDLWINTPRRPWEACGTSGMKILVNGGMNLSELDGWWAEAYQPEVGWALGDGQEHDDDPSWDAREADELFRLLEQEVVPRFYHRNDAGIPIAWIARVRTSMAELTPRFSANRMVREYVDNLYLPAAQAYRGRVAEGAYRMVDFCRWRAEMEREWPQVHFAALKAREEQDAYHFTVGVYLGKITPDSVQVQLYAEPRGDGEPEIQPMQLTGLVPGSVNVHNYSAIVPSARPVTDYTPRVVPHFEGAAVPLEVSQILWYR